MREFAEDGIVQDSRGDQCGVFAERRGSETGSGGAVIRKSRGGDGAGSALARSSGVHRDAVKFVAGEKRGSAILRRADYGVRAEHRVAGGGGGGGGAPNRRSPGASLQRCSSDCGA